MPFNPYDPMKDLNAILNPGGNTMAGGFPYIGPYNQNAYSQAGNAMQAGNMGGVMNAFGNNPGASPSGMWGQMNDWWGQNGDMVGGIMGGLGTLGGLWGGMQNLGLQKDQFKFQKNAYKENMAMQKQDLNRKLGANWRDMEASGNTGNYQSLEDYLGKHKFT